MKHDDETYDLNDLQALQDRLEQESPQTDEEWLVVLQGRRLA
jgi:hypothetical protein